MKIRSFDSLDEREKRVAIIGGVIAVLVLVLGIILPLDRNVARTHARVVSKQADLAWMRGVTPELIAAGPAPAAPTSQRSMLVVVDGAARAAGLGPALTR